MKRLTMLLTCVLEELALQMSLCAKRDIAYATSRFENEGESFFTLTLPMFETDFLSAIEDGQVHEDAFLSFRKAGSKCLPAFLSGFTNLVFDDTGAIREEFDPDAVFCVRQICNLFKKINKPCTLKRERKALKGYLTNEESLFHKRNDILSRPDLMLDSVSAIVVSEAFGLPNDEDMVCGHGPGVTADRRLSNERRRIVQWHNRAELSFPSDVHAIPNFGFGDRLAGIRYLDVKDEQPVRVVFVPKTLKAPRVIAIEPSNVQFTQQGLMKWFCDKVRKCPLTSGIEFLDQSRNYEAARKASVGRHLSTMDLSDASDLVSLALVQRIFATSPVLSYLEDTRSLHAVLPDGTSVLLQKFASMGSAMCFPVEAFVFYVLILAAVHEHKGWLPTAKTIRKISQSTLVYGDDIIVDREWHEPVIAKLEAYGLKVNQRKSFARSHFRESCGGDFYKGIPVRPVYLRESIPDRNVRWSPTEVMSISSCSDQFYMVGMWQTAQLLRGWVEKGLNRRVPISTYETGGLTFKSVFLNTYNTWSAEFQHLMRRTVNYSPVRVDDDVSEDDIAATFLALDNIRGSLRIVRCTDDRWRYIYSGKSLELRTSVKSHSFRQKNAWAR